MNATKSFLTVVLVLVLSSIALAADIYGEARGYTSYSFADGDLDYGTSLRLKYNPSLSDKYYLFADLTLKYQDENNFSPVRLNELYVQGIGAISEDIDFKIGYLHLTWGASDAFSPVDNVNPRPFNQSISGDVFDDKIPILGLDVEWYMNPTWSLEFVYQPEFRSNFTPDYVEKLLLGYQLAAAAKINPSPMDIQISKIEPDVSFTNPIWDFVPGGKWGVLMPPLVS